MITELIVYAPQVKAFKLAANLCKVQIVEDTFRKDDHGDYHILKVKHQYRSNLFAIGVVAGELISKTVNEN